MPSLMIVEYDPLISIMIELMAQDLGWQVMGSVKSDEEAQVMLKTLEPDLVILNIGPAATGRLDLLASCRARGVAVLFTTGYAVSECPPECDGAPILSKPFTAEEFESALRQITGHKDAGVPG